MQLHRCAQTSLKERVVQILSNTHPLLHAQIETMRDLSQSQFIEGRDQDDQSSYQRQAKPHGLVIRRVDGKIEGRAGLVPYAAVVAGAHAKSVVAWRKIVVESLPARSGFLPI